MWQSFVVSTGIRQDEDTLTGKSFYKSITWYQVFHRSSKLVWKNRDPLPEIVAMQKRITKMITVSLDEVINDSAYLALIEKEITSKMKTATSIKKSRWSGEQSPPETDDWKKNTAFGGEQQYAGWT